MAIPQFSRDRDINRRKSDATMCMVVGCERTALYRNKLSKRGYCGIHREFAINRWSESTKRMAEDSVMFRVDDGWRPAD